MPSPFGWLGDIVGTHVFLDGVPKALRRRWNLIGFTITDDEANGWLTIEATGGGDGASLSDSTPLAVGTAAAGDGLTASRWNHIHAHGDQSNGSLHAIASGATPGFYSDEMARDAIGALVVDSSTIDATYTDGSDTLSLRAMGLVNAAAADMAITTTGSGADLNVTVSGDVNISVAGDYEVLAGDVVSLESAGSGMSLFVDAAGPLTLEGGTVGVTAATAKIESPIIHLGVGITGAANLLLDFTGASQRMRLYDVAGSLAATWLHDNAAVSFTTVGTLDFAAPTITSTASGANSITGSYVYLLASGGAMAITASLSIIVTAYGALELRSNSNQIVFGLAAEDRGFRRFPTRSAIVSATTTQVASYTPSATDPEVINGHLIVRRTSSPTAATTAIWRVRHAYISESSVAVPIGTPAVELVSDSDDGCTLSWTESGGAYRLSLVTPNSTNRTASPTLEGTR